MSVGTYLQETRSEIKHVNWPTRQQTISFTTTVIAFAIFTALLLGACDLVFHWGLQLLFS